MAEVVRRGTRASEQELTSAAGSANRIRSLFERERDAALSRDLGESARAAETLLTSAGTSLKTLRDLAQSRGGRPAALDPAVLTSQERELASLRGRIGGTSARDRDVLRRTVASARALDDRLAEMVRTYGQQAAADSGVPPDLLQGAQAFFSGRYQDAVTQLEALRLPSGASSGFGCRRSCFVPRRCFRPGRSTANRTIGGARLQSRQWPNAGGSRRSSSRMRRCSRPGSCGFTRV